MAKLEAAKKAAAEMAREEAPAGQPPPLPRAKSGRSGKPAHLLVAELEAEERAQAQAEADRLSGIFSEGPPDPLAEVEAPPTDSLVPKRSLGWERWVFAGVAVAALIAGGYAIQRSPEPEVKVDPRLAEEKAKTHRAVTALEKGHAYLMGKSPDVEQAIASYRQALGLSPKLAAAERGLAIAFARKSDHKQAVAHYRRYLKLDPDAPDAKAVKKIIRRYERARARR